MGVLPFLGYSAQEPTKNISTGDNSFVIAPDEDNVSIDDIISFVGNMHFELLKNVSKSLCRVTNDNWTVTMLFRLKNFLFKQGAA